jgi:hypothetical protein
MRRRSRSLLLALLLVIVGGTATATMLRSHHPPARGIAAESAADAGSADHTVTFVNDTNARVWVGSWVNADGSAPLTKLPVLDPGKSATITIPEHQGAGHWRGRFFAREGCSGTDGSTFHCAVGDCGPYVDHCSTTEQPASLAEFNFDPSDKGAPWYDVSYVDAVSAPVTITPDSVTLPQSGECAAAGCAVDLLSSCPTQNVVKDQATGKPLVCVNPNRDAKSAYSDAIAHKCPLAYAWSKQDTEAGNRVMRNCTKCRGLTVTFQGAGGAAAPSPSPTAIATPDPGSSPPGTTGVAVRSKKGVGLNAADGASQELAASGVSWYYNWTSSTGSVAKPAGSEYVPMIWGPGSVTDTELGEAVKEGSELLTFQEPDLPSQSNMSVDQALKLWPRLEKTGMRMSAPAVASGADVPGGWLDRFMQGAAKDHLRVDFIPVHWFGGDFGPNATQELRSYLQAVYNRYHKPIWLTEYALTDYAHGTPRYPSQQQQTDFIKSSTQMLDSLSFVERYSWFALSTRTSPTGLYDGTTANAGGQAYHDAH